MILKMDFFLIIVFMILVSSCRAFEMPKGSAINGDHLFQQIAFPFDTYLSKSGITGTDGFLKFVMPSTFHHHTVCYPMEHYDPNRQAALVSHVACRQMGYMTFSSSGHQKFLPGFEPKSVVLDMQCTGEEQSIEQCTWKKVTFDHCIHALTVWCSSCFSILEVREGYITSPGYPVAYFYTLLCEWDIIVPEGYRIIITFRYFNLPRTRKQSISCSEGQPYLEIMYGVQKSLTLHRYCTSYNINVIEIPARRVKIRFFSGVSVKIPLNFDNKYGFYLLFRADPVEQSSIQIVKILSITGLFILFFILVMSCYCCRRWIPRRGTETNHLSLPQGVEERRPPSQRDNFPQSPQLTRYSTKVGEMEEESASGSTFGWSKSRTNSSIGIGYHMDDVLRYPFYPTTPRRPTPIPRTGRLEERHHLNKLKGSLLPRFASDSSNTGATSDNCCLRDQQASLFVVQPTNFTIYNEFPGSCGDSGADSSSRECFAIDSQKHSSSCTGFDSGFGKSNTLQPPSPVLRSVIGHVSEIERQSSSLSHTRQRLSEHT